MPVDHECQVLMLLNYRPHVLIIVFMQIAPNEVVLRYLLPPCMKIFLGINSHSDDRTNRQMGTSTILFIYYLHRFLFKLLKRCPCYKFPPCQHGLGWRPNTPSNLYAHSKDMLLNDYFTPLDVHSQKYMISTYGAMLKMWPMLAWF